MRTYTKKNEKESLRLKISVCATDFGDLCIVPLVSRRTLFHCLIPHFIYSNRKGLIVYNLVNHCLMWFLPT
ncbi:MAG: hypothetical protein K0Q56_2441 [Sporolactobacillus laevolacticus]|jgi:hypothetical protein|nr:hypothetical protein [Sporolactobacillus laevolacticus]